MHSMGHILPDQIANRRGWGGCRLACRPTLRGVLHTHPRCSGEGQHHEPEVTPIDDIEADSEQ